MRLSTTLPDPPGRAFNYIGRPLENYTAHVFNTTYIVHMDVANTPSRNIL